MRTRTVLVWLDYAQFEMACQVLEQAGIPFERHGRHADTSVEEPADLFPTDPLEFPTDPLELRVLEQDVDRARRLLAETVGRGVVGDPSS